MQKFGKSSLCALRVAALLCLPVLALLSGCAGGGSSSSSTTPPVQTTPAVALTVTSVSPTDIPVGSPDLTLVVNGTGFSSSTVVSVGGTAEATSYVSSTEIHAAVPAAQLSKGAVLNIAVANGSTVVSADAKTALSVDNPVPTITAVSPSSVLLGSTAASIAVTGTNFVQGVALSVNGNPVSTTFVSSTQLTAALSADAFSKTGSLLLNVINPQPGGGASGTTSIAVNNPVPSITSLSPATAVAGATSASVTVNGSGILPETVLQINGATHAATYVSNSQMTVSLSTADLATAQTLAFTLVNAAPGGGTSAAANFSVTKPVPTANISSVNPTTLLTGAAATLNVYGSNLNSTSVVQWNGTPLTTTYQSVVYYSSPTPVYYLSAQVPASLLTAAGTGSVTVYNAGALTPTSNAVSVTVTNPPAPTLTTVVPNYAPINADAKVTLIGTGFTASTTASLNGATLTPTAYTSTSLTVTIPASALSRPGLSTIAVTTPAPGGGTTAGLNFTAYVALATNSMVYNPVNGLLYVSVPGSAGTPLGNSVVSVDPATGALGTPIAVGSEPNRLAVTSDGKYLWVALDGAAAVRKVDLSTGKPGLQFSIGRANSGVYNPPATVLALAALPGSDDSVVVTASSSAYNTSPVSIYDNGVQRSSTVTGNNASGSYYALQVDGSRSEIYAGGSAFATFNYSSAGLALKAANSTVSPAGYNTDEMQLLAGRIYTDSGTVLDAESGALLGTFYSSGSNKATGPTVVDAALGKAFVVDGSTVYGTASQVQVFNTGDFTPTGQVIPIGIANTSYSYTAPALNRLTRWGANGLAFRATSGIYSFSSNMVKDLSSVQADLGVTLATTGSTTTGSGTTFTATVTNAGPSSATDVVLTATTPSSGVLTSVSSAAGPCYISGGPVCTLGTLASGASASVNLTVLQTAAGTSSLSVRVSGSTTDTNASNDAASASAAISGIAFNVVPMITAISPSAIVSGAKDTTLTVRGAGFTASSQITVGTTALPTTFTNSTTLVASVPASSLAQLGWLPVSVSTPAPGGGTSSSVPLTVYSVITLGANHMLYDPYSRQIMLSVGSGSATVTGNSIAPLTPETATIGTPVSIGSQPTSMALTSDGQILYTILTGSQSIARFNMLTRQADYTYTPPSNSSFVGGIALRGIAAQPGTENTVALDIASFSGNAIYDFDPAAKTAKIRGQASGPYSGSCLSFLDATNLLAFDTDTSGATLDHYTVTSSGFTYYNYSQYTESTLNHFGCFKLSGNLAFANGGGIADPSTTPATQVATLPSISGGGFSTFYGFAPDAGLGRAFYPTTSSTSANVDGLVAFDLSTYLPAASLSLNLTATEGGTSFSVVDAIRWGQDGLALLTSTGHVYLLRGPFVAPQLLNTNTAATLSSSSSTSITHGAGNTLLTLTGSNFVPGVAVTWNGSYRTTTIVDATHVTVAIPASDLASAGTGSLVATNPGAPASAAISVTVQ